MNQVVAKLRAMTTKKNMTNNYELNITTTTTEQDINESIFDLRFIIDGLVNYILEGINEGQEERVIKQYIRNFYYSNHKVIKIYNWLLNDQNHSNSIYLLGYFNYHGIETNINRQNACELYQKAAELGNSAAQFDLTNMYIDGKDIDKNYDKAFELSKTLAEIKNPRGINLLGHCYYYGIGTSINKQKAFELYQEAADLGNIVALYNLAN